MTTDVRLLPFFTGMEPVPTNATLLSSQLSNIVDNFAFIHAFLINTYIGMEPAWQAAHHPSLSEKTQEVTPIANINVLRINFYYGMGPA